ncbi:MAG: efflux RND transporter periplasmic adaptor subunit, partial [Nitrospirota bacterium]
VKEMEALTKKADANYSKAKADYERYRRLYDGNAATLDELETFERQFKFAEAELAETNSKLDRAKTVLRDYTLKSPIDGIVITKHLEPGETAGEGTPILTLADLNSLKITAELDETDVGKIQIGQKAEVSADAYRGSTYYGKVDKISEDVKRKKIRTFDPIVWMDINTQEITIALDSFEGLVIGMTVDVKFNQE